MTPPHTSPFLATMTENLTKPCFPVQSMQPCDRSWQRARSVPTQKPSRGAPSTSIATVMVAEAHAMVLKATGVAGGGETPNASAHVND